MVEERVYGSIPVINLQPAPSAGARSRAESGNGNRRPAHGSNPANGANADAHTRESVLYRVRVHDEISLCRTELLRAYLACNPKLRTLAHIIEVWSGARDINDAPRGTLSSYAFLLMLISVLQRRPTPALPVLQLLPPCVKDASEAGLVQDQDRAVPFSPDAIAATNTASTAAGVGTGVRPVTQKVGSYEPLPRVWVCDYQSQPRDTYFCNVRPNPRASLERQYSAVGMDYTTNLASLRAYCDRNTESVASLLLAFFESVARCCKAKTPADDLCCFNCLKDAWYTQVVRANKHDAQVLHEALRLLPGSGLDSCASTLSDDQK